jgi:hypothetical protein
LLTSAALIASSRLKIWELRSLDPQEKIANVRIAAHFNRRMILLISTKYPPNMVSMQSPEGEEKASVASLA